MYQRLAGRLRRLADELDPPSGTGESEGGGLHLGVRTRHDHGDFRSVVQETALALNDPENSGFLVIWTRFDRDNPDGALRIRGSVPSSEWPAYFEAMNRIKLAQEEFTQ